MKLADAKGSSIIFLHISTLGRKSCPGKTGRVWDGKAPDSGQLKEGALQRHHPEPRAAGAESAMGTAEGTMGSPPSQPAVGREAAWVGGCQSPPLQRGVTATCSAAQEMLNVTQRLRSNRGTGRSEGGTLPQSHPPLHPPRRSHVAALGPTAALTTGPRHPTPPPAPWPRGTLAVALSKLLKPCCSSAQHPSPGPGFLGARPPWGMLAVRLSPARQLWHSAPMQISASSAVSTQHGVAGCVTARVYMHPAAQRPAVHSLHGGSARQGGTGALYTPRTAEQCKARHLPGLGASHCTSTHGKSPACMAELAWAGKRQRAALPARAALCPAAWVSLKGRILLL